MEQFEKDRYRELMFADRENDLRRLSYGYDDRYEICSTHRSDHRPKDRGRLQLEDDRRALGYRRLPDRATDSSRPDDRDRLIATRAIRLQTGGHMTTSGLNGTLWIVGIPGIKT
jgi:hypothetical protein